MTYHSAAWHFELTCFKFGFSSHRPVLAVAACLSGGDSSRKTFNSGLPTKVGQNDLEDPLQSQIKKWCANHEPGFIGRNCAVKNF